MKEIQSNIQKNEEDIKNGRKKGEIDEAMLRTQNSLLEEQQQENRNIEQLHCLLASINWSQLPSTSPELIEKYKKEITELKESIDNLSKNKIDVSDKINQLLTILFNQSTIEEIQHQLSQTQIRKKQTEYDANNLKAAHKLLNNMVINFPRALSMPTRPVSSLPPKD